MVRTIRPGVPGNGPNLRRQDFIVTKRHKQHRLAGRVGDPVPATGRPATGRIVRIVTGQNHGFIRDVRGREVFFHRSDLTEGTFNRLVEGDEVTFEVIEDRLSGPRAIHVRKKANTEP